MNTKKKINSARSEYRSGLAGESNKENNCKN